MKEVVNCSDLVMFIFVKAISGVVVFKPKLLQMFEHGGLDGDFILADDQAQVVTDRLGYLKPVVVSNLMRCYPLVRVCAHDTVHHVGALRRGCLGDCEISTHDFLVKLRGVLVLEREVTGDHRKHDDTTRPDIDPRSVVRLSAHHFWSSVAR